MMPAPPLRRICGDWVASAPRRASLISSSKFCFLNEEHFVDKDTGWSCPQRPTLWNYNLHYFDDLNAWGASEREALHRELIAHWLAGNEPGKGVGWEPYPTSLRIVNWIKWALIGNVLDDAMRQSLAVQVRFLTKRLECHLLGNHLFANAKALIFAGCLFDGDEAADWLSIGMEILAREVSEQILADGGHFERSAMYHALAYEDMLDLVNLCCAYPDVFLPWASVVSEWKRVINNMSCWLKAMCHPDGEVGFFNDAAIGIAPPPYELFAYADRLGFDVPQSSQSVVWLDASGYIRVSLGGAVLLIDVAPVGPDYLPGHAHADTLSFEMSLFGNRLIVNSGTSRYGLGRERERERGTAAHSTLEIDGQNSSEVWGGFRVARRANPLEVSVRRDEETVVIEAAHDGYRRLPGRPTHRRRWVIRDGRLEVTDFVEGGFEEAVSRIHFHPDAQVLKVGRGGGVRWRSGSARWESDVSDALLRSSEWYPEFGLVLPSTCLEMRMKPVGTPATCCFILEWV